MAIRKASLPDWRMFVTAPRIMLQRTAPLSFDRSGSNCWKLELSRQAHTLYKGPNCVESTRESGMFWINNQLPLGIGSFSQGTKLLSSGKRPSTGALTLAVNQATRIEQNNNLPETERAVRKGLSDIPGSITVPLRGRNPFMLPFGLRGDTLPRFHHSLPQLFLPRPSCFSPPPCVSKLQPLPAQSSLL